MRARIARPATPRPKFFLFKAGILVVVIDSTFEIIFMSYDRPEMIGSVTSDDESLPFAILEQEANSRSQISARESPV